MYRLPAGGEAGGEAGHGVRLLGRAGVIGAQLVGGDAEDPPHHPRAPGAPSQRGSENRRAPHEPGAQSAHRMVGAEFRLECRGVLLECRGIIYNSLLN